MKRKAKSRAVNPLVLPRPEETLGEVLQRHSMPVTESGCWIWVSALTKIHYGQLAYRGQHMSAHRASWQAFRGEIPSGLHVLHRCNVGECINPDHLYLGTDFENARDRVNAGTQALAPRMLGSRHPMAKLDERSARQIRQSEGTHKEIGARFGVCAATVGHIKRGRQWTHA